MPDAPDQAATNAEELRHLLDVTTIRYGIGREIYLPYFWYYWVHSPETHCGAFGTKRAATRALKRWCRWALVEWGS